jgi:hypothetical protein
MRIANDEAGTESGGRTVRSGRIRRFEIIFRPDTDEAPIPLESVVDANQATMAFHAQVQRLMREGTPGELVIMNHHDKHGSHDGNAVLRQPLRQVAVSPSNAMSRPAPDETAVIDGCTALGASDGLRVMPRNELSRS